MKDIAFLLVNIVLIPVSLVINLCVLPFRLLFVFLRDKFSPKRRPPVKKVERPAPLVKDRAPALKIRSLGADKGRVATLDFDEFDEEEQHELVEGILEKREFSQYTGKIRHGYDLVTVTRPDTCPRCHAQTEQQYGNFVYATDSEPRVMFAPAGYFCQKCPTVIVDQNLIRQGVIGDFEYAGVLGLDHDRNGEDLYIFDTWNGKTAIYVLDEHGTPLGIETGRKVKALPPPLSVEEKREKVRERRKKEKKITQT